MKIEVAIPCYNEEATVSKVVSDFRNALAEAQIAVYDNNSTDRTAELAAAAGAKVIKVPARGKGNVVREIFALSDADVIVMVDGDDTYEAADVKLLIAPVIAGEAGMAIGTRLHSAGTEFRKFHLLGNKIITVLLNLLFGTKFTDILSGYRAFSGRFAKNVPLLGTGFEIESELMIQALESGMAVKEVPIRFRKRPEDSRSKLNTFRDGYRIIITIVAMLRDHRPMFLFSLLAAANLLLGGGIWLAGFLAEPAWPHSPAFRKLGVYMLGASCALFLVGLILNTVNVRMREVSSLITRRK